MIEVREGQLVYASADLIGRIGGLNENEFSSSGALVRIGTQWGGVMTRQHYGQCKQR